MLSLIAIFKKVKYESNNLVLCLKAFSINSMAQDTNGWIQWLNVFSINTVAQDTNGWTHSNNYRAKIDISAYFSDVWNKVAFCVIDTYCAFVEALELTIEPREKALLIFLLL